MPREISSIIRASKILRCLADDRHRIKDIAEQLHLSKGTVHGILETLKKVGLAGQDPSSKLYCLGPLLHQLASNPLVAHKGLILCSFSDMMSLRDLSEETVALMVPNGSQRIILEEIPSPQPIRYAGGKGLSAAIYTGAPGKALLSQFSDRELSVLLNNVELVPAAPNTITDRETLLSEIEKTRQEGYATSFGERLPGSACIAVPVKDYFCPAALSIIGPEDRFSSERMLTILDDLKRHAASISEKIKKISQIE